MLLLNSFSFWVCFPLFFCLAWIIPYKVKILGHEIATRNAYLLVLSYSLYIAWKPSAAIILAFVSLVAYLAGIVHKRFHSFKKCWVFLIMALFPLLFFKYYSFIAENISLFFRHLGFYFELQGANYAIPIGISFFTFMAVGYICDVFNDKIQAEGSIVNLLLFLSFFPQIVSGPISRANQLLPQIKQPREFDIDRIALGFKTVIWGLFFKLVVADRIGIYVDHIYGNIQAFSGFTCFIAVLLYSVQIYADFAGYSMMAIGVGEMLGFRLPQNFNQPYFSASVTEFWRRWHISLSQWLKDYIYIPLGGSRCSKLKNYVNILVTFLVSGIWHGANWNYIVWGVLHGIVQIFEKMLGLSRLKTNGVISFFRVIVTFLIVSSLWIVFRLSSLGMAASVLNQILFKWSRGPIYYDSISNVFFILVGIVVLFLRDCYCEHNELRVSWTLGSAMISICLIVMILSCGVLDSGQFIYATF